MLNVLNGVYHPQQGTIRFQGKTFKDMDPHEAAALGIARTFQNIALFKGMTVLDNIMTGRNLKMRCNFLQQALCCGPAGARSSSTARGRGDHRLPRDPAHPQDAGRAAALRPAEARRARPGARRRAQGAAARRADGRHEPRGKAGHVPLRARRERAVRHHDRADRARHGRGDGHLRPRGGARLRPQDRRRLSRRSARTTRRSSTPTLA